MTIGDICNMYIYIHIYSTVFVFSKIWCSGPVLGSDRLCSYTSLKSFSVSRRISKPYYSTTGSTSTFSISLGRAGKIMAGQPTPPNVTPLKNEGFIRPYGKPMFNKLLIGRPYFEGGTLGEG